MSARLAALELGDPAQESVVLLHAAGSSGWMWRRQAEQLAQDLHVLIPDMSGHGASADIPWRSINDTATRIAELIVDRTAAGRAHIVGLSLGGYVALTLATAHPGAVSSAIASGVTVVPFPNAWMMRVLGALMSPVARTDLMLDVNARTLRIPPSDWDGYRAAAKQVAAGTTKRVSADAMAYRLPKGPADVPVLAVAGEREHPLVLESLCEIAEHFPRGAAALAPGGGHAWNAEQPELFTTMVRRWVLGGGIAPGLVMGAGCAPRG